MTRNQPIDRKQFLSYKTRQHAVDAAKEIYAKLSRDDRLRVDYVIVAQPDGRFAVMFSATRADLVVDMIDQFKVPVGYGTIPSCFSMTRPIGRPTK